MNKNELIDAIADSADLAKSDTTKMLNAFVETVTDVLVSGDKLIIPGFGTFEVGERAARTGRNPQTGEPIQIAAARVAKFKVGKALKDAVNNTADV